jgi:hypothetical protein
MYGLFAIEDYDEYDLLMTFAVVAERLIGNTDREIHSWSQIEVYSQRRRYCAPDGRAVADPFPSR